MSTLATCPDWCTWGHTLDPGENSHDGPSWATVGDRGDEDQASVSVGQAEGQHSNAPAHDVVGAVSEVTTP